MEKEIVICAAVRYNGKVWIGHRHHQAMSAQHDELGYNMTRREMYDAKVSRNQGFVTSHNRFVGRIKGMSLQLAAGIKSASKEGYRGKELYSEDLY